MATSGALSTNNDNIKYKITINQNSQNIGANTSNVTVSVRVYRTNTGYTTYGTGTIYCKINGTTYSDTITSDDKITSSGITLFSKTLNISHGSDGSKTLTVSSWINHSQFTAKEQDFSLKLTTIPRATTPTINVASVDMGKDITVSMPRASSSFTHTLKYAFSGTSGTIGTGLGTSKTWTVPLSLASRIPNGTSGTLTITCETYNGSTKIGSKTDTVTIKVPSTVVPTISSVAVTDTNPTQYEKLGGVVKGKSKLSVVISASGAYGSTISSYSTKAGGKTYSGSSFTVSSITTAGSLSFAVTVKDSRGRSASTTKSINVVDYENPIINNFSVIRADSDGTPNDEGESLLITYGFDIAPVNNKNDKSYTLSIKGSSEDSFSTVATGNVYSLNTSIIVSDNISVDDSYVVRLNVKDYFKSLTHDIEAPTAFTLINYGASGKSIGFGKVAQRDKGVEFGMKAYFENGETTEGAIVIPPNTDIDTLITPGYYVFSSATSTTLKNLPFSGSGSGSIEVFREGEANQVRQIVTRCSANREIWERLYYSNKFQSTHLLYRGGGRILWSGGYYMTAGHKIALSQKISEQEKGIVLVFSRYSGGSVQDYHFNHFFVSKEFVELHAGEGSSFIMTTDGNFSVMACKYLYIHDDLISGNDVNNASATGTSGITYNNAGFVLRYVIGV